MINISAIFKFQTYSYKTGLKIPNG